MTTIPLELRRRLPDPFVSVSASKSTKQRTKRSQARTSIVGTNDNVRDQSSIRYVTQMEQLVNITDVSQLKGRKVTFTELSEDAPRAQLLEFLDTEKPPVNPGHGARFDHE